MKCEFCDKEANVHLKQVLQDEELEMHLCEECAEERGLTDPAGFSLQGLLGGEEPKLAMKGMKEKESLPSCVHCGFDFQDLKKVGRLGCHKCYDTFGKEISEMLTSMHRGTEHKGKKPGGLSLMMENGKALEKMNTKLKKAIADEDFELAAKLRDEIKGLEGAKV